MIRTLLKVLVFQDKENNMHTQPNIEAMYFQNLQTIQEQQQLIAEQQRLIAELQQRGNAARCKGDTILFEEHAERWFSMRKQLVSVTTWHKNRNCYDAYLYPAFKGLVLTQLDKMTLQSVMDTLAETRKPATMKIIKSTMNMILNDAMDGDLIPKNYMSVVKIKQGESDHKRALTQDEIKCLLLATEHERLWIIPYLGLGTGMRPEEMLGLKWECVNLDEGYIYVEEVYTRDVHSRAIKGEPKTKSSKRRIYIGTTLIEKLRQYQKEQREQFGKKVYVLGTRDKRKDGQTHPTTLDRKKYKWRKAACIPDFTMYFLRHTYASIAHESGIDELTIARQMGHVDTKMLEHVYIHQRNHQDQINCASVLDTALF